MDFFDRIFEQETAEYFYDDDESEFYNPYEGMGRATDRDIEMFEDPADFPTYDPAQSLTDYTFFEYDDQGRIDVAATEDNQDEYQKLDKEYGEGEIGCNTYTRQIAALKEERG